MAKVLKMTRQELKRIRVAAGLSRPALAAKIGVSAQTLWRIETGQTGPKAKTVEAWMAACSGAGPGEAQQPESGDEYEVMRSLGSLSPAARRAVLAWARAKWPEDGGDGGNHDGT